MNKNEHKNSIYVWFEKRRYLEDSKTSSALLQYFVTSYNNLLIRNYIDAYFFKKRSSVNDIKKASKSALSCSVKPKGLISKVSRLTELEINLSGSL